MVSSTARALRAGWTTTRRLRLGFGALIVIQLLSLVVIGLWLRTLQGEVQALTERAEPARAAAYEMQVAAIVDGQYTWEYLVTGQADARQRTLDQAQRFTRARAAYAALAAVDSPAATPQARQRVTQVDVLFSEYLALSTRLMDRREQTGLPIPAGAAELQRFAALNDQLIQILDEQILQGAKQQLAVTSANALTLINAVRAAVLFLLVLLPMLLLVVSVVISRAVIRTEQTLRVTLSSIADGVITTDRAGRVATLNPVAEQLTGWPAQDARGQPLQTVFRLINEETRQPIDDPVARALREGVIAGPENHTLLIAKDGAERPIVHSAAPIRYLRGELAGTVLSFRDFSAHRQAERTLEKSAAALAAVDRRKDHFLAVLSHELRNPLAALSNAVQLQLLPNADVETQRGAAQIIGRQVGVLVRLLDDLLDVSRIKRGGIPLRKTRIALAPLVNNAVEASRGACENKGLELTVSLPPQPLHLNGDPIRLAQAVGNLLDNACKFTDKGGHIRVVVEAQDGQVLIRVQDNGIGIATEQLARVFDLFVQGEPSLEGAQAGFGIGLALTKIVTEMHGGAVRGHSAGLGLGSEFTVVLPLAPETEAAPGPAPSGDTDAAKVLRRILVVDDHVASAQSLTQLLKSAGHEVHTAYDGHAAVALARDTRPEVILLDIGLPGLNGYEVALQICGQPWGRDMTLIAVTGWGAKNDMLRSHDSGFQHHLVKPVNHADLIALLARLPVRTG